MKKFSNWRLSFVFFLIILFGAVIVYRLFFVQILDHKQYQALALGQQVGFSSVVGQRGQIFSENSQETKGDSGSGEVKSLAVNREDWAIFIDVEKIDDRDLFLTEMTEILGLTEQEVSEKLDSRQSHIMLKNDLTDDELSRTRALDMEALSWQNSPERFYPQENFLSQTLGFLGGEGLGQYGVEGYYDDILQGKSGVKQEKRGLQSIFAPGSEVSLDGSDIYLTIDYNIQFQAESLLKKAKQDLDIDAGQIIVLKPDSGRVVALAGSPSFDLNHYYEQEGLDIFQNGATQKLFEPGSVMKPFTMAAALNEGKISPDTVYTDSGSVSFGLKTIHNFNGKIYGKQTMTQVLENSVNTGAVFAEQLLGNKKFFEYIEKFGFTEKTGIDIQGEVYSRNTNLKNGPDMNFATASFGQGIEATPMQVAGAFSAFANGGRVAKPYVVQKIVNSSGEVQTEPKISEPIISEQALSDLTSMLVSVIENGLDKVAKIPGYYLAGKTGTAQVPLENKKGYDEDKTIQSFVGFGPAYDPEFLILVKLDNPKVPKSTLSAVPVFKELAQYIINYWKIPPDYDISSE